TVPIHTNDSHHAVLVVRLYLFFRGYVVGVAHGDIQLVVRANTTGTGTVVKAFFCYRNKLTLGHDNVRSDVRTTIEKLRGGIRQDSIVFDTVQNTVARETNPVR